MSSLNNKVVVLLLLISMSPWVNSGVSTTAGLDDSAVNPLAVNTEPTRVESMARIPKASGGGSTLTCWQEGRQVFQSRGFRLVDDKDGDGPGLLVGAGGRSIRLMDLKSGLCILENPHDRQTK